MSDDVTKAGPPSPSPTGGVDPELGEIRRVGRYELQERIGRGGMGVVYRGKDSMIGRAVAIKMLVSDIDVSEESRERFYREARSAGQLAHRNIITIYDFGEEQGRAYIVMELLSGQSLAGLLAGGGTIPIEQQVEIMARMCEGLAFAHARGIVHRDIKPANLFVTAEGQIKILDFGVARISSSKLTRSGLIVGTPDYMSPEQVMGKVVDQRSDVFSAGTVFYELLSRRRPFGAKKLPQILHNVMSTAPVPLTEAEAPAALSAIVMKSLEKEPGQRYQRMVDMLVALTGFLQGWERQTREIAQQACEAYRENERLIALWQSRHEGQPAEEVAAAPLLRDLPLFQDRGADVLKVVPFRRATITEIVRVLREQRDRLMSETGAPLRFKMPPPIPTHIGRYEILGLLGRGGMGVLYRAKDPTLDREVAVKMMLVNFSFDDTARERFEREAKAVARLQHSNVVTIHELGQHEGAPYIVMELLSGEDLDAVLRRPEPLPLSTKLEVVAQLCEGLAYAHEQGIVHRDIKPANVRLLEDGTVKILDFGIAKFAQSSMTQSGAIIGTAHYMAPEQILGNPIDGRADLFAVGVLLHELLSGQKPFGGDSPTAIVYQIVHVEAPSVADTVSNLPEGLNDIVARALKKDPNERYNSANDMASDLRLVKMMLDLPLTQTSVTGAGFDVTMAPGRLHATGILTRPQGPATGAAKAIVGATKLPGGGTTDTPPAPPPPRGMSMGAMVAIGGGVIVAAAAAYASFGSASGGGEQTTTPAATPVVQTSPTAPAAKPGGATGVVVVGSVPQGARIVLNGADTGKATPSEISLGGTNRSTVELTLKGYQPFSATLTEADIKRGSREFRLVREAGAVRLSITGAFPFELTRAGAVLSPSAAQHEVTIPPGAAPVIARSAEFLLSETVPLDFQKPQAEVTLKAPGVLAVFASNETCSIIVDGQDLGFPPLARKPIAAGAHTVVLRCSDGKEDSRKIVVAPGERSAVTFGREDLLDLQRKGS